MASIAVLKTEKQKEIVGIILREASFGRFLCQTEIYNLLSYKAEATYGALRVSIRFLVQKGILAKKREGSKTYMIPTDRAYDLFQPRM